MRIVVAMSGGVDSSVTAGLLHEQGHEVIGIHMKLHDVNPTASPSTVVKTCCGFDDAMDARRVAAKLDIPFYIMNLKEEFQKAVLDDFAGTYLSGATPIPCIQCNGVLKFRVLLARARELGASHLATGHYARIVEGPTGLSIASAMDPAKDQSYFLFPVTQDALSSIMFPLGEMTKPEVRAHATRLGLVTADKPESQEICFIPDGDHTKFVNRYSQQDGSGEIVDEDGKVLGYHDGYYRYTVGQRKGLGIALSRPAYVLRIEPDTHRVVVTMGTERLDHVGLEAYRGNWFDRPDPDRVVQVRIRHRGRLVPARVGPGEPFQITLLEPERAISAGQAAVVYDGDRVLGGGWIKKVW